MDDERLAAEQRARVLIDRQLTDAVTLSAPTSRRAECARQMRARRPC